MNTSLTIPDNPVSSNRELAEQRPHSVLLPTSGIAMSIKPLNSAAASKAQEPDALNDHDKNNFRPGMEERVFWTGRHYALDLAKHCAGEDWIARLMQISGRRRDETEWLLQEDMVPPDDIRQACEALLASVIK